MIRESLKHETIKNRAKLGYIMNFLNNGLLINPHRLNPNTPAWTGHIPFAGWLMVEHKPNILVELGTHAGVSYSAFCQAIVENNLSTKCYAVDTWQGDVHSCLYNEDVYLEYSTYHQQHFSSFSQLLRMTFDEALNYFSDNSVDLLHIDGLHTYEAVKHDFEAWLPKMSNRGIILFHDTNVRERNFGVWKLWEELSSKYPSFEFQHSHGLGVLLIGSDISENIWLLQKDGNWFVNKLLPRIAEALSLKNNESILHQNLTDSYQDITRLNQIIADKEHNIANFNQMVTDKDHHITNLNQIIVDKDHHITHLNQIIEDKDRYITSLNQMIVDKVEHISNSDQAIFEYKAKIEEMNQTLSTLKKSLSWRLAKPMRLIRYQIGQMSFAIMTKKAIKICHESRFLDANWYLTNYPDVRHAKINPAVHYVKYGAAEGRDPGPEFSTMGYLAVHPHIQKAGVNPLVHFEKYNKFHKNTKRETKKT